MADLDFYADFACDANVLGVGLGSTPAQWETALGDDYLDDPQGRQTRRDYGLIETTFFRRLAWECSAVSIQVHRLSASAVTDVPKPLREEYGDFSQNVSLAELKNLLQGRSFEIEQVSEPSDGEFLRHWLPSSGVIVHSRDGYLWALKTSENAAIWSKPSTIQLYE